VTVGFQRTEAASGDVIENFVDAGRNPPEGVIIHYWLRDAAKPDGVKLSILDAQGNEVRSYSAKRDKDAAAEVEAPTEGSTEGDVQQATGEEETATEDEMLPAGGPWVPIEAGMNRIVWNYRYEGPTKLEKKESSSGEEEDEGPLGPKAAPGEYQVRLTIGQQTFSESFRLEIDPRLPVSLEDLQAQFKIRLAIRDRTSETIAAINQIGRIRQQVEQWEKRAGDRSQIKDAARALKDQLKGVEAELTNVDIKKPRPGLNRLKEKWEALGSIIDESDHAPTRGAQEVYDQLTNQLQAELRKLTEVVEGPVKSFNDLIQKEGVPPIAV
jgi:hypothetical protein